MSIFELFLKMILILDPLGALPVQYYRAPASQQFTIGCFEDGGPAVFTRSNFNFHARDSELGGCFTGEVVYAYFTGIPTNATVVSAKLRAIPEEADSPGLWIGLSEKPANSPNADLYQHAEFDIAHIGDFPVPGNVASLDAKAVTAAIQSGNGPLGIVVGQNEPSNICGIPNGVVFPPGVKFELELLIIPTP